MKSASVCLLDDQLRSLLEEDLLPQEAADCEAHLATCPRCRDKVESLIGNADWWQEAEDSLRSPQDRTATIPPEKLSNIAPHADILRLLGPTDNPQMLGRIGSYEIVGILGRGGMGVVFKGFDPALNRFVAIKMLAPHLAASGAARKRFEREAQAAAAIVHDHVMAIHGVADWQGTPYLVMPYVRGASLQKRIDDQGPFQLREILRIGMQTAAGLAAAHAQGLVHRDIKPANIMLASGVERVALTDFGLARAVDDATLTRTGTLAGTPQYMSPEQARGQAVDFRSDLFSLGSVLYTLCTGRPPFRAETSYGILRLITDEEPRPIQQLSPDIPVWLCTLIGRLMAKNPADRFASADEVSKLLEKCLAHVEQPSLVSLPTELLPPAAAVASPAQAPSRTFSKRYIAIASGLLLAVIGIYFGTLATNPPEIAGTWQGEDWGTVVLKSEAGGQYAGEFSETVGKVPGQLHLKWSRIERRYNGTWKDGDERLGDLSLRLVDQQIRGAYSTSANSKTNPATPRLADLTWTRTTPPAASNTSPPTKTTTLDEVPESKSSFDILFDYPGIYRLSIYARRQANENSEAGPLVKELGTQVVEVLAKDVTRPVARIKRIKSLDNSNSNSPTYHYQLLSGTLTRPLGSQTLKEKEASSFKTSPDLRGTIACEHQSTTKLATYQENGWEVQLKLHVQHWALDSSFAPKEDRVNLSTSGYALLSPKTEDWYRENPFIDLPGMVFDFNNIREAHILIYPPSQADLQLTPNQFDLINSLQKDVGIRQEKIHERKSSEYQKAYFSAMELGTIFKPIWEVLNPEQKLRLNQLVAQAQGYNAFKYGYGPAAIKPTPSQRLAIDLAIRNFEQKITELASKEDARLGSKDTNSEKPLFNHHTFTKQNPGRQHLLDLWQTIHDILSEEQRQKFNEFRGPPLKNFAATSESLQDANKLSSETPPSKTTTLENIPIYKSSFEILFNDPGIYRLSIHARRRVNENPEAGPFVKELGTQVVEVLASDVSHPVALIERIRTFDKLPSKSPTYHYQLLSGTLTRSLGSQTLSEKEDSSFQTNLNLPRIVTCEHQSVAQLANFQEDGWQVQLELHVQRWAPDDTAAPKENRMRLGGNSSLTSNAATLVRTNSPEWFRPDSSPQAFLPRGGSMPAILATGRHSYLQYITSEDATKDLGLNSNQRQEIEKVMATSSENWFNRSRQIHNLLTAEQQEQVQFELNQRIRLDIFENPAVMQRLGITRDQQAAIALRLAGLHAKRQELYNLQRNPDPTDRGPLGPESRTIKLMEEVDSLHLNAATDIHQRILTAEQSVAFNALQSSHAIRQDVWLDGKFPCSSNQAFVQPTQNATIPWSRKIQMRERGIYRFTLHGQRKVLGGYSDSVRDPEFTNYGSIAFASPTNDPGDFTLDFMTDAKNSHPHWRLSLSAPNQGTSLHLFQDYLEPSALTETSSASQETLTPSRTQFIQLPTIQSTIQHETLWLRIEYCKQGEPGAPQPQTQNATYQVDGSLENFASDWHRDIPFPELPTPQLGTFSNTKIEVTTLLSVQNELAQLGKDIRGESLSKELEQIAKTRPDESKQPYRSNSQGVFQSLTPAQYARLLELTIQQYGFRAFTIPEIVAPLQLSKDQESAIQSAIGTYQGQLELLAKESGDVSLSLPDLFRAEYRLTHNEKGRVLLLKVWQKIYDELTPRQRAQFRQLRGQVFTYPFSPKFSPLKPIEYDRSSCDIAFEQPGIYRLSISSSRHETENPNNLPVIAELGYQVVEVHENDVGAPVAKLEQLGGPDLNSGYLMTSFFQLQSGILKRPMGQQAFSDKALSTLRTSPNFPETITCKHESTTPIATYQENGWQGQLELQVKRWDLGDTSAPKENRMRLFPISILTSNFLLLQDLHKNRQENKREIGLCIPPGYIANVAIIARGKNAARVLRRFHVTSQREDALGRLSWEVKPSEQADSFPVIQETLYATSANQKDGAKSATLLEEHKYTIEPRLFNPLTRENVAVTKIDLVVPFIGGSDLPLEVASGETKEALLFFDVSADQIEHEIWLRVSLDTLPQNIRPQNAFHTALGSSWKALRYPRPESETADVELSIPLSNEGYDLPLDPGIPNDLNVQMQQLEMLAPYTQGAGLDGSHDLVLQTSSDLKPEILASITHAFSHHTQMRIRTRPAESKNLRTLASPSAEKIKEAFSKALQGNWKCIETLRTNKEAPAILKQVETVRFAGEQLHIFARGQKPEEKTTATFELDAAKYPAWITIKSENEVFPGILTFLDGKLLLQFGISPERPLTRSSSAGVIGLLLEKVPETTNPNSIATSSPPAAKVLADKVIIKSARTVRNHLLVDIEMNVALTPSWLRSLYLGPDRPLTSADMQNGFHDYPLVSSVSDWPLNGNYQLSLGNQSQRFAFLFPSNEAASLALKQVDDLSRKGPQTLTATTALQLFRVEYDDKTYQGGIDIREGAAASTNLNAPVRLTLFVPYTFTLDDWKKFAAELEGPDVRILITQDAKGRNRPIQASLKIDPKYSYHDLRSITDALEKLGLLGLSKESTRKEPEQDYEKASPRIPNPQRPKEPNS